MVMSLMSRLIVLALCSLAPLSAFSCELKLHNASRLDLAISVDPASVVFVNPGESQSFSLQENLIIEFGIEAHDYDVAAIRAVLCPGDRSTPVQLKAQPDGTLWLDTPGPQPNGFPLRPIRVTDLTYSPSNNSFKPNPHRGGA